MIRPEMKQCTKALIDWIAKAPTAYQAIALCEEELQAKKELLASLTGPEEKAAEPEKPQQQEPVIDTVKLKGLSNDSLQKKAENAAPEPETMSEDLSSANQKLKDMLSGMSKKD